MTMGRTLEYPQIPKHIFYIVYIFIHQALAPLAAVPSLQQNTWNSKRTGIVICPACITLRFHKKIYVGNLCHFPAFSDYIFTGISQAVYIGNQSFKSISAMKINIIICFWEKFFLYSIGDPVCCCTQHTSWKYTVQIFSVFVNQTHGSMLKSTWIHQMDDHYFSYDPIRCQCSGKLDR